MGPPLDFEQPAWKVRRSAAAKIQAIFRVKAGAKRLLAVARSIFEVGYDARPAGARMSFLFPPAL